jgi:predicted CXXCH cytochrome family protein
MRNTLPLLRSLGALALLALSLARLDAATIVGTKHDMSSMTNSGGQLCVSCHTPHNAQATQLVPLWNHTATNATFTTYSSATMVAVQGQPSGFSKACMSCHDGTIALDSFGGKTAAGAGMMTGGSKLGTDLTNDHPISITYDAALAVAKRDMISPVSASFVDAAKTVPLFAGKMECSTCHNSHDNANGSFLRKSNAGSALCLSCHKK